METKLQELKNHLLEVNNLNSAVAVLSWDQSTYMPPGGGPARARQMATLSTLAQEKLISPEIGRLLDDLRPYEDSLPYDSDDASLIRVARQDYERWSKIPPALIGEVASHNAVSFEAWKQARPEDDFARMVPFLEKTVDLSREVANCFPGYDHIADPLIDFSDNGMKATTLSALFGKLRTRLVPIVRAITSQPPADDSCLRQHFPQAEQMAFGEQVVRQLGYDFNRGRVDLTYHPFMTQFSIGDVRITTRVKEDYLAECLFGFIHEAGHAMYGQGIRLDLEGTPLADGTSAGLHESQSRLWENVVGRSREFWTYFYPRLQEIFPSQLGSTPLETFYRAINKVEPSLIRTDADEVTYNLHVMLRFDFELALLDGRLAVKDLPEAWNERYQSDLGITPPDHSDGVLQDVHWFAGLVGGSFQGYTLGNILNAQFYELAIQAHPQIPQEIEHGQFGTLHSWLIENIYQHGRKYMPDELIQRVTGGAISLDPYIRYLERKYGQLYPL